MKQRGRELMYFKVKLVLGLFSKLKQHAVIVFQNNKDTFGRGLGMQLCGQVL